MPATRVPLPPPARCVLDGVPRVGFYDGSRCPEDVPFPSCLRATLEFLGENYGCDHVAAVERLPLRCTYAYLMAVSGAAFRLLWNPGKWDMGNCDVAVMADDCEQPFRRAFEAVGAGYEMIGKLEGRDNETLFRQRIVASINRGVPVMAFGVIGPPEICLVAGYDDGGDVLIGWNYFQAFPEFAAGVETEPSGYFRKRDWFAHTPALLVLNERTVRPPLDSIVVEALRWALQVVRTPRVHGRANGLAAYAAWSDDLLDDTAFTVADPAVQMERYLVHFDATGGVAEGRWYASLFLKQIAEQTPHKALYGDLSAAAACYVAEHDLMWDVWNAAGGNAVTEEHARALSRPEVRRAIVPLVLRARDKDMEAAAHLDRAVAALP